MINRLRQLRRAQSFTDEETHGVVIGYIQNASESDATTYALAWAEKYMEAPAAAGLFLKKHQQGYLYELQERGIGKKAWLPSILAKLDALRDAGQPELVTIVQDRILQAQRSGDRLGFVLLPESGAGQYETTPGVRPDGPLLKSLRQEKGTWLLAGKWILSLGLVALVGGLTFRVLSPAPSEPKIRPPTPVAIFSLPIGQWSQILRMTQTGSYIARMEYQHRTWQFVPRMQSTRTPPSPASKNKVPPPEKDTGVATVRPSGGTP